MNKVIHGDCLEVMPTLPDKSIDLTITDPPYGVNIGNGGSVGGGSKRGAVHCSGDYAEWDSVRVDKDYFTEIMRVSKNVIVWGGNYYTDFLPPSRCWLVWYKRDGLPRRTFADCEMAWTSLDANSRVINIRWDGFIRDCKEPKTKHPTQKPITLFEWCIREYSSEGDLIFDPFAGSGTTAIACLNTNRNYILIEKEKEYIDIINKRIAEHEQQQTLFN